MIANFKPVYPNLWRGGQPESIDDWQKLADMGIKTVLKLNTEAECPDELAGGFGINVIVHPIDLVEQIMGGIPGDYLPTASKVIGDSISLGAVFVHCEHGEDRTGLVIGAYQVCDQGWTKEAAWQEMLDNGFHELLVGLTIAWHEFRPSSSATPPPTPPAPWPSGPASSGPAPAAPASAPS